MLGFGFVPEFVHFGEGQFIDMAALLVGLLLDVVKARNEFAVGALQRVVGANPIETRRINQREEQITELLLTVHVTVLLQLCLP